MTTRRPTRRPPSRTGPRALERWLPLGWVRLAVELLEDRLQPSTATLLPATFEPGFPALGPVASIVSSIAPVAPPASFTSTDLPAFTDRLSRLDVDSRESQSGPLSPPAAPRHELVLVEFDVPDRDELLHSLLALPGGGTALEVVELHGGGVAEITGVLRGRAGLDAIHIVSHGAAGALDLGSGWLDSVNLGEHAGELRAWGAALKPGGDLLFYGCSVAATEVGRGFVTQVSRLTGADVAASTDPTGTAVLGGNWGLEYSAGAIQTAPLTPTGWTHILTAGAPVVTANPPTGQIVVDTTSDAVNGDTSSITALEANKGADGRVSLREAILAANNTPNGGGPDQITFAIPGSSPHTISPGSALPTITDAVEIDGTTQPGFAGAPVIVLNGTSAGASTHGLILGVGAAGSTIRGLVINRFGKDGIRIAGGGGNRIAGNYIGTNTAGSAASGNGYVGVEVVNSANNVIGGTTAADRNVISGNASDGLDLVGTGSTGNVVSGNYVGTDATGNMQVGNGANGVWIGNGASTNTIGGTTAGSGNLVAGNIDDGIEIEGSTTTGNVITGNWVGLTATGIAAMGNDGGVLVQDAPNTTIGGALPGAGNVISGNVRSGILVFGLNAIGTRILGNLIGTDPGGTLSLGNGLSGIGVSDSGDGYTGIGSPTNTTIGGTAPGEGNTIAFNIGLGVVVEKGTSTTIRGNSITSNTDIGIDLGRDGITPNDTLDADTGPNRLQNFPVLTAVTSSGTNLTAIGNLQSTPSTTFNLDFYASPAADPSGYGEGALYLGTATVTTNASGNAPFSVSVTGPAVPAGWVVTATATDPAGNTSEFSPAVQTNRQPTTGNDTYTTAEDTPLTIANPGVLGNDTDPDGDPLTVSAFTQPTHGTLTLGAAGGFTYTPVANYNGPDAFTYTLSDGRGGTATATVSLTVTPVNDPPTATNDAYSTAINTPIVSTPLLVAGPGVLGNDSDPDGDPLTVQLVSGPSNGLFTLNSNGSFTYTAILNFAGTDSFMYRAFDGATWSAPATVFINVSSANQAPTATADSYTTAEDTPLVVAGPGVLANDTDPDGDTLSAVLDTGPTHGTLALGANGGFTYTPAANYNGPDTFTYHAIDGSLGSAPVMVTLNITSVNDSPTLTLPGNQTVPEDAAPQTVALTGITAGGGETQTLTITATSSNLAIVPNPVIGYASPGVAGTLTFTPVANANGTVVITVTVSDGVATVTQAFTVNVTPVNDPPTAAGDSYTTLRDNPITVPASGILTNDTDADGDPLSAMLVTGPTNGTVVLNVNGSFIYTPGPGFTGTDSFTYAANDGTASSTAIVTIAVLAPVANLPPQGTADSFATGTGTTLTTAGPGVLANDTDPEGDSLTAVLVTGGGHGTVTLAADGSFSYTPDPGFTGTDQFTYQASDGQQLSGVVTVTIQVIGSALPQQPTPTPTSTPNPPPNGGTPTNPTPTPTNSGNPPPNGGTPTGPAPVPPPTHGAPTGGATTPSTPTVVFPNETPASPTVTNNGAAHVPNTDVHSGRVSTSGDLNRFFVLPTSVAAVPEPVPPAAPSGPSVTTPPAAAVPPSSGGPVVTPTPAPVVVPVAVPVPVPEMPPEVAVAPDNALAGLDQAATDIREETRDQAVTDTLVVTGGVAVAGYVLLNTRAVYWFLSALLARPAVWRRFDPLDVIYAWEQDRDNGQAHRPDPGADESLQSMVG